MVAVFATILSLANCTTPYVPVISGPMATIKVDMHNVQGDGSLNLSLPREHTLLHSVLTNPAGNGEAQASTVVPASQVLLFDYTESVGSARCDVDVSMFTRPDRTYLIFVGDTPPTPRGNNFLVLLCHKFFRTKICWQHGQRGSVREIARAMAMRTEVIEFGT
jgi:hypothetical protein